jgi:hypothetical protein
VDQCTSPNANDSACVLRGIQMAEEIHVWSVFFCSPWLVAWVREGLWFSLASGLAVHVNLNVYPILHLRLARSRIEKIAVRVPHRR